MQKPPLYKIRLCFPICLTSFSINLSTWIEMNLCVNCLYGRLHENILAFMKILINSEKPSYPSPAPERVQNYASKDVLM